MPGESNYKPAIDAVPAIAVLANLPQSTAPIRGAIQSLVDDPLATSGRCRLYDGPRLVICLLLRLRACRQIPLHDDSSGSSTGPIRRAESDR